MTEFFKILGTITRRGKAEEKSPFASAKAAEKWLETLPANSDYDAHHALVEGLERFNAENEVASISRMNALMKLEEAGLPLQLRIVEQYLRNQGVSQLARQARWRETWMFWSMLAEAWLEMLKQAYQDDGAELKPFAPEIAARALHYAGLVMRWNYHRARSPEASAWRRIHKIYRLAERDGYGMRKVLINGRPTHSAREYSLVVLMGLVHPIGYRPQEVEAIARILGEYEPPPLPTPVPQKGLHTHVVDLSLAEGASVLEGAYVQGRRLRYFAFQALIDYLRSNDEKLGAEADVGLAHQTACLIERGGIRRNLERTERNGRIWAAEGIDNILAALADINAANGPSALEPWLLRDESDGGMGFSFSAAPGLPSGRLVAVNWEPSENRWQLLAVRWTRQENGQHLVGTQCLSRHPRRVEIHLEEDAPGGGSDKAWALFMPMNIAEQGVSNLLLPQTHYRPGGALMLRDGDQFYRLYLGDIQEKHEGWLRVGMDVVGQEQLVFSA